jgi:hypothetical protein
MMGYVAVWGGLGFLLTSALVAGNERSRIRFERVLGVVGFGEQRSSYGMRSITALMESATLCKVDATEAALRAERGLDRFP